MLYLKINSEMHITHISDATDGSHDVALDMELQVFDKELSVVKIAVLRSLRDKLLSQTIWIAERHLSQKEEDKTLSNAQYEMWQTYWQDLRDLPATISLDEITFENIPGILPTCPAII